MNMGNDGNTSVGGMTMMMAHQSLNRDPQYRHLNQTFQEVRRKKKVLKQKIKILQQERRQVKQSLDRTVRQVRLQRENLDKLSTQIRLDKDLLGLKKSAIDQMKRRRQTQLQQGGGKANQDDAALGRKILLSEKELKAKERDHQVDLELRNFGKETLEIKQEVTLERRVRELDSQIEQEKARLNVYAGEVETISGSLATTARRVKQRAYDNAIASATGEVGRGGGGRNGGRGGAPGQNRVEEVLRQARELKLRLDQASPAQICRGKIDTAVSPVTLAQSMLVKLEFEILSTFDVPETHLMNDIKTLMRELLMQNCGLRRQANGMEQLSHISYSRGSSTSAAAVESDTDSASTDEME